MSKRCYKCGEYKPTSEFHKDRSTQDQLHRRCKDCTRSQSKKWNREHRDRVEESNARYHKRNPGKKQEIINSWRVQHPERWRQIRQDAHHKHRSLLKGGDTIYLDDLYASAKGICGICNKPCTREDASIDHIIPVSKGGEHKWCNVQLAHITCNKQKGNKVEV